MTERQTYPSTFKWVSSQRFEKVTDKEHTHGSGCNGPEKGEIFSGSLSPIIKLTHSESSAYRQLTVRDQPENHEYAITAAESGGIDV